MNSFTEKTVYLLVFTMLSVSSFAAPEDPDPGNDPPAPIDSNLYLLLFFGIAFMIYYFYKKNNIRA